MLAVVSFVGGVVRSYPGPFLWGYNCKLGVPYFPVDNARVIYTKKYIKWKKTMVRVIHKVRVMQLKSEKSKSHTII
jgi:hypothetical protein